MSRQWKPGDVGFVPGVGVAVRTRRGWYTQGHGENGYAVENYKDVRPLVVIDPEDREQVANLALSFRLHRAQENVFGALSLALRSLVADPKPEEPTGLGAVVLDRDGETWIRNIEPRTDSLGTFRALMRGTWASWADIDAVEVLSEGVTQ